MHPPPHRLVALLFFLILAACPADSPGLGDPLLDGDLDPAPLESPGAAFAATAVRSEVTVDDGALALLTYDAEDTVIGRVAISHVDGAVMEWNADYLDGAAMVVTEAPIVIAGVTSVPADELIARAEIAASLVPPAQAGILSCAKRLALAAALCAPLAAGEPWGAATCSIGVIETWCACAPLLGLKTGDECDE